jgi:hypothetical protein
MISESASRAGPPLTRAKAPAREVSTCVPSPGWSVALNEQDVDVLFVRVLGVSGTIALAVVAAFFGAH